MLDDSLLHSLRQIHGDHLPEITLSLLGLLLAHIFPLNYLTTGGGRRRRAGRRRRVNPTARWTRRLRFYATTAWTVARHLRSRLRLMIRRGRATRHGGAPVTTVTVHVAVYRARATAAHVVAHVVPGIAGRRGGRCRCRAAHVAPVRDVLLVSGRIVHHVSIGHVTVGHLIHVARQLGLLGATVAPDLPLIHTQHPANARHPTPQGEFVLLEQGFCLAAGPVLVVGVLLHVHGAQSFRLVDEGTFLRLAQQFPLGPQTFRYLRVVHLGILLGHLPPLPAGPHHERVHRPFHAVDVVVLARVVIVVGGLMMGGLGLLLGGLVRVVLMLLLLLAGILLGQRVYRLLLLLLLLLLGSLHRRVMVLRGLVVVRQAEAQTSGARRAAGQRRAVHNGAEAAVRRNTGMMAHWRYTLVRWHLTVQAAALQVRLHREHFFFPVPVQFAAVY